VRALVAAVAVVVTLGGCAAPPPSPPTARIEAVGDAHQADAATSRGLLSRDVDHPPAPDCATDRYDPPDPATLPEEMRSANARRDYRFTSERLAATSSQRHQLCGSRGPGFDLAWGTEQGRSDVTIAVLDSGIEWRGPNGDGTDADDLLSDLAPKVALNTGELPLPRRADGSRSDVFDLDGDGAVTILDYRDDPTVIDRNDNGGIDPEDLLLDPVFSDGVDDDANGYVDDIAGWDFLFDDNDPLDDVTYGHGTGEANDSVAASDGKGRVGTCPQCSFVPVRVSDSFIAEGGRFAAGVLFALDSGADVIQEALGALNNPTQAQAAVDAAYRRGVPVVASMADEASKHPNLPVGLDHTIAVNSVTRSSGPLSDIVDALGFLGVTDDVLALNGCTNYGGLTWVSVPSGSCSSEATGIGAGLVGLVESAARRAGVTLSANEVAQLLRGTADDVDFSTPYPGEAANDEGSDPGYRYPTTPGWDATFGFGRVNAYEAVRAAAAGEIPPEADLVGPRWFDVLPASGAVDLVGSVAAPRSGSYSYRVEWATGLQPPPWPGTDQWHRVASAEAQTAPFDGALAQLDLATVAAALPDAATGPSSTAGRPDEDRFAVRLRVVVTDAEGRVAVAQRQVFVHDDPQVVDGFPKRVAGAGASSPVFAQLDGAGSGGAHEMVVATDDGDVHVYRADGSERPGFPVRTEVASWWHEGSLTATEDAIAPAHDAIGVGAPVVTDLDGDGRLEIAVADTGGHVTVWSSSGVRLMRASVAPAYSTQSETNSTNRAKRGFLASPAAADLDGDGSLELVAAAMDRHVYAWHLDGTAVEGFPVLVVDPAHAKEVDPVSHRVTFDTDSVQQGGELIVTPAVGDLDGDGRPEIVVGTQEQYQDSLDAFPALGLPGVSGTTRAYAIWGDGTAHTRTGPDPRPAHPADQAYLPGWPVKLAMMKTGVLPTVGDGTNAQAAIGDVTGDGRPEVLLASSAGPLYAIAADGSSALPGLPGLLRPFDWIGSPFGANASSRDGGIVGGAFGGPSIGQLIAGGGNEVVLPTIGLRRTLDQLLPNDQRGDTQLMAWDGSTAGPLPGFPHLTRDLAFFITPAIVDVDSDGRPEAVAGHGVSLLDAVDAMGKVAAGYPKLTGGWVVGTPGFGDLDGDGFAEMAISRRDGVVMVWHTEAPVASLVEWPRFGHDGRNSGAAP